MAKWLGWTFVTMQLVACGGGKSAPEHVEYAAHCECQCVDPPDGGDCNSETFTYCFEKRDETSLLTIFASLCAGKIAGKIKSCALTAIDPTDQVGSVYITATPAQCATPIE